jgi:hypothetical protein
MAANFQDAVERLAKEIGEKETELAELKRMVNFLRSRDGQPPLYQETEVGGGSVRGLVTLRPDEYYGKSPITAAREYLEKRGQAALPDEIAEALERGSFDYKAQGWLAKENWGRNLAISMSKNSGIFHRLPNGYYGLVKWYPELKRKKRAGAVPEGGGEEEPEEEILEEEETEESEANDTDVEGEGRTPPNP